VDPTCIARFPAGLQVELKLEQEVYICIGDILGKGNVCRCSEVVAVLVCMSVLLRGEMGAGSWLGRTGNAPDRVDFWRTKVE
jgi:hypothetical protein